MPVRWRDWIHLERNERVISNVANNAGATGSGGSKIIHDPSRSVPLKPIVSGAPLTNSGSAGQINQGNLLGQFDVSSAFKFLGSATTNTSQSATEVQGSPARAIVVLAGSSLTEPFNISSGDKLDLTSRACRRTDLA